MFLYRSGIIAFVISFMLAGCVTDSLIPERFRSQQAVKTSKASANVRPNDDRTQTSDENVADAAGSDVSHVQGTHAGDTYPAETASRSPATSVGRADLPGRWKVTSGNDNCQLFMSLTGWSGGYRAITKGCSAPVLAGVEAWSINGEEIALLGGDGDPVVRLTAAEKTRLNGKTSDGQGIIVFR